MTKDEFEKYLKNSIITLYPDAAQSLQTTNHPFLSQPPPVHLLPHRTVDAGII
jgi:hypothetical protein